MNNTEQTTDGATTQIYTALISMISATEDRLRWSELIYFSLNIFAFIFLISFITTIMNKAGHIMTYMDLAFIFIFIVIGMSINAYWIAFAMRIQLKLKLRYFQARNIERKLNGENEFIFSDESIFFDPDIRQLKSRDNKDTLLYPTAGLTRMDGFIGAAKPRHFSWIMPCMFSVIYWSIFILVLTSF